MLCFPMVSEYKTIEICSIKANSWNSLSAWLSIIMLYLDRMWENFSKVANSKIVVMVNLQKYELNLASTCTDSLTLWVRLLKAAL